MSTSSVLKQSLLAACLFSVCLGGCSKDKKESAKTSAETTTTGEKAAPKGETGTAPKSATSSALAYLPADCAVAMHADLKSLSANSVIKAHLLPTLRDALATGVKSSEDFKSFMDATGFDPFADLHEFSGCLGEIPLDGGDPVGIMTVTGNINSKVFDELV
jgi:hypothetical protein